jgi:hypothetical protein
MDVVDLGDRSDSAVLHSARGPEYGAVLGDSADLADCANNFRLRYSGMKTESPSVIAARKLVRDSVTTDLRGALLEIKAAHPGMRIEDLMQLLRRERPSLWQEGQRLEEASLVMTELVSAADEDDARKSARIKRLAGEYKQAHPTWSFDRCWSEARSKQRDLFEEGE